MFFFPSKMLLSLSVLAFYVGALPQAVQEPRRIERNDVIETNPLPKRTQLTFRKRPPIENTPLPLSHSEVQSLNKIHYSLQSLSNSQLGVFAQLSIAQTVNGRYVGTLYIACLGIEESSSFPTEMQYSALRSEKCSTVLTHLALLEERAASRYRYFPYSIGHTIP